MSGSSFGRSLSKVHFVRRLERGGEPSVWSGSSYAADPVRQKLHRGPVEFFLSSWDTLWLRELCVRATLLSKARPAGFSADLSASKSQSRISSQEFEMIHLVLSHLPNPDQIQIYLLLILVEFVHWILRQRLFLFFVLNYISPTIRGPRTQWNVPEINTTVDQYLII